jgi:ABC-type nitrate/sulfonate/bicarbonate transport system substrate-binding protein
VIARGTYTKLIAANRHRDLKTLEDFKGKRVGAQVGTGVHTALLMILERKGLSEQDLGITNLRVVDMPAAMASGSFDGVVGWEPMMQRILQGGHGVQTIGEDEFNQSGEITFPFLLTTRSDYRDKHPKVVQAVVNAYAKAHHFIRTNKDEAIDILATAMNTTGEPLDRSLIRAVVFAIDRFETPAFTDADWKDLRAVADFAYKMKQIEPKPDLDKVVDNSFGKRAATAVGQ